jgi:SPP1 family predicted phage head-tail adaptor
MNPELEAGKLDRRVTLLRPAMNEHNDEIEEWTPVGDVWASVEPSVITAREADSSGRIVATNPVVVRMRYRADVDIRWRISDAGKAYEVRSMADPLRRRAQLQLTCEEVQ